MQVGRAVMGRSTVGVKVDKGVEGVAFKEVVWAMCRWRLSVKWKRYLVKRSIEWIRHGEGFIFFDGEGEFEPDA